MVDSRGPLGGVCLNVGCIPSKALLHAAKVIAETKEMAAHGLSFAAPTIDLDALRGWKDGVVTRLTGGLTGLAKQRKVTDHRGHRHVHLARTCSRSPARTDPRTVSFDAAIIAAGSEPVQLPFVPHDDPRVIDSTGALELDGIPERLLVLGGGIIGLEMATVYAELGVDDQRGRADGPAHPGRRQGHRHPARQAHRQARTRRSGWAPRSPASSAGPDGLTVSFDASASKDRAKAPETAVFDAVLVAVGRRPNGTRHRRRRRGRVRRRARLHPGRQAARTNVGHIFAIGDVVGQPMLAHKAVHEGKVAAENTAGQKSYFDATRHPVGGLHRSRGGVGRRHRERGQGAPGSSTARACSRGPRPAARCRSGATRASPRSSSTRPPTASSAPGSSAPTRATSSPRPPWPSRWAPTPPTSASRSTRTRPCRRPSAMAAEAFEGTLTDLYLPKRK